MRQRSPVEQARIAGSEPDRRVERPERFARRFVAVKEQRRQALQAPQIIEAGKEIGHRWAEENEPCERPGQCRRGQASLAQQAMAIEPRGEACARRRCDHRDGKKAVMPLKIVGFVNALCNADEKSDPAGDSIGPACATQLRPPHRYRADQQAPEQAPPRHEAERPGRERASVGQTTAIATATSAAIHAGTCHQGPHSAPLTSVPPSAPPAAAATTSQRKANGFDPLNTSYCWSRRTDRK